MCDKNHTDNATDLKLFQETSRGKINSDCTRPTPKWQVPIMDSRARAEPFSAAGGGPFSAPDVVMLEEEDPNKETASASESTTNQDIEESGEELPDYEVLCPSGAPPDFQINEEYFNKEITCANSENYVIFIEVPDGEILEIEENVSGISDMSPIVVLKRKKMDTPKTGASGSQQYVLTFGLKVPTSEELDTQKTLNDEELLT